jgi:hypothetical protein
MISVPRFVVMFVLSLGMLDCAGAQPAIDRPQDSNMRAGQLFTVRIAPAGQRIEVFVAGKDAAAVDFSDVHLLATVKVGSKRWFVVPEKKTDRFVLTTPIEIPSKSKAELRLLFNSHEKEEILNFDLKPMD